MLQHPAMHPQLPDTLGEPCWGSWLSFSPVLLCVFVFPPDLGLTSLPATPYYLFVAFLLWSREVQLLVPRRSSFRYREAVGSAAHRAGPADAPVIRASFHPAAPMVRPDPPHRRKAGCLAALSSVCLDGWTSRFPLRSLIYDVARF